MHIDQITDALDCGSPEDAWKAMIAQLKVRAQQSDDIGEALRRDAQDALDQADGHFAAAQEFHNLVRAMERAPVTFAAGAASDSPKGDA